MGMDVYGRDPDSPAGKYFRANVWSWRPIHALIIAAMLGLVGRRDDRSRSGTTTGPAPAISRPARRWQRGLNSGWSIMSRDSNWTCQETRVTEDGHVS